MLKQETLSLSLIHLSVTKKGSTNIPRVDPPWMAPPTSNSPPPPWEPTVDPWDDPQSHLKAPGQEWAFPPSTGNISSHAAQPKNK